MNIYKILFQPIKVLFFPNICVCCGRKLNLGENSLCTFCIIDAPITSEWRVKENNTFFKICDRTIISDACVFIEYRKSNRYSEMIHNMKFKGERKALLDFSCWMGNKIYKESEFYRDIDIIIPTPLHWLRRLKRGYNQAEVIALGLNQSFNVVVNTSAVKRVVRRKPQVEVGSFENRWNNAHGIFKVIEPEILYGKHILIVDDVITTGATLVSLIETIKAAVSDIRISVISLSSTVK